MRKLYISGIILLMITGLVHSQIDFYAGGLGDGSAEAEFGVGDLYQYPGLYGGGTEDGYGELQLGPGEIFQYPFLFAGGAGDGFDMGEIGDGLVFQYAALFGGGAGDGADPQNFGEGTIFRFPSLYGGGSSDGYTTSDLDCNFNLEVSNTLQAGTGSLSWALSCVIGGDTVKLMPVLAQDTIWVEDQLLHLEKSCMISGLGVDWVTIATHHTSPFIRIASNTAIQFEHFRLVENGTNGRLIDVHGDLTLREMQLIQHQGASSEVLYLHPGGNLRLEMQNMLVK